MKIYSLTNSDTGYLLATSIFLSELQLDYYSNIVGQSRL